MVNSKMVPFVYQTSAVDAVALDIAAGVKRILVIAPTGSGKSVVIAEICRRALDARFVKRILVLCHQGHILKQNESTLNAICSRVSTGIYCAGEGRKDVRGKVIFASRDSLARDPFACGKFDMILCDEAHLIDLNRKTNYQKIIEAHEVEGQLIIVGFTGSPWRLKGGNIWGRDRFFEKVAYNIAMDDLVKMGRLVPYVRDQVKTKIDVSQVPVSSTGDYKTKPLEAVSSTDEVVEGAITEWQELAADRKCSLFFCCSRDHGRLVYERIGRRIGHENVCYVDGDTRERGFLFDEIRAGRYKVVVNVMVFAVGFDAPIIDCVAFLRATKSPALFVQAAGRALRVAPGKKDALILDFAGNFDRFGSLERPLVMQSKLSKAVVEQADQTAPMKTCPQCQVKDYAAATKCGVCGHVFITHLSSLTTKEYFDVKYVQILDDNHRTYKGERAVVLNVHLTTGRLLRAVLTVDTKRQDGWAKMCRSTLGKIYSSKLVRVRAKDLSQRWPINEWIFDSKEAPNVRGKDNWD